MPWDVTPGVPAYAAAAALLGRELTVPEVAQTVILTRAQARLDRDAGRRVARASWPPAGATLVLHLAITRIRELAEQLAATTAPTARWPSWTEQPSPEQLVLRGTLADIAEQVEARGLRQAAVIMVGAALGGRDFVESHLYGPRVARRR